MIAALSVPRKAVLYVDEMTRELTHHWPWKMLISPAIIREPLHNPE